MDLGLRGKVALVAAASRGLGRAVAHELAKEGAKVIIFARGFDGVTPARKDEDLRALLRQLVSNRATETATRRGDECDLVL